MYSVVSYGLEAVAWKQALTSKIELFQNKIMRALTNTTLLDKISIDNLKETTNLTSLWQIVRKKKENLFETAKENLKGTSKLCLEGLVEGKRSTGRRQRRWTDDIKEWSNSNKIHDAYLKLKTIFDAGQDLYPE